MSSGVNQGNTIDPRAEIGWTALTVGDLGRSVRFYEDVIGFKLVEQSEQAAVLGAGSVPLLVPIEQPGARPKPPRATGLYHFAIMVPTRVDLGRSLRRLAVIRYPLAGYADHLVSEALYLSDPDGNGIEIYRDRPRDQWTWRGKEVVMASDPIDLDGLLAEAERDERPWTGLPEATRIGHMHLQVADLHQAEAFYHQVLGFDIALRAPGALFISAGGYHHHIGLNTWNSRGAPRPPADAAGLRAFTIAVTDEAAQARVAERLEAAGVSLTRHGGAMSFADPWGNGIMLAPAAGLQAAAASVAAGGVVAGEGART